MNEIRELSALELDAICGGETTSPKKDTTTTI